MEHYEGTVKIDGMEVAKAAAKSLQSVASQCAYYMMQYVQDEGTKKSITVTIKRKNKA